MTTEHESSWSLENRVAVVTGGAAGIGLQIARRLDERGARVVLNDINEQALGAAAHGFRTTPMLVVADVSSESGVDHLIAEAEALSGHIDILVNNAGVLFQMDFLGHTVEDWDRVLGVNMRGVFLCMRAALPGMIKAGKGSIVNLASVAGQYVTTQHVAYATSKAAVIAITQNAAHELAPLGIKVNAIAPGLIDTDMTRALPAEVRDSFLPRLPMGWGHPTDVAAAAAYLASDESRYMTGVILPVAGGADLQLAYAGASS